MPLNRKNERLFYALKGGDNMELKIKITKELYDWALEIAKESDKTLDQFIEDAIWFYKNDIERQEDPREKKKWRF